MSSIRAKEVHCASNWNTVAFTEVIANTVAMFPSQIVAKVLTILLCIMIMLVSGWWRSQCSVLWIRREKTRSSALNACACYRSHSGAGIGCRNSDITNEVVGWVAWLWKLVFPRRKRLEFHMGKPLDVTINYTYIKHFKKKKKYSSCIKSTLLNSGN